MLYFEVIENVLSNKYWFKNKKTEYYFVLNNISDNEILQEIVFENIMVFTLSENDISNIHDVLWDGTTVLDFILKHRNALKYVPCFLRSHILEEGRDNWSVIIDKDRLIDIKLYEFKEAINKRINQKYPTWKQQTLLNDKNDAVLQISNFTNLSCVDIEKRMYNRLDLRSISLTHRIEDFERIISINFTDFAKNPNYNGYKYLLEVPIDTDVDIYINSIIKYELFYSSIIRARKKISNIESEMHKLETLKQIEEYNCDGGEYIYIC